MQRVHRQPEEIAQVVPQAAEVGGDDQFQARRGGGQRGIGGGQRRALPGREIEREDRLVELHPLGAEPLKFLQHLPIDGQQPLEQVEPVEIRPAGILHLAERQVRDRAEQHGFGGPDAGGLRLGQLMEGLRGGEGEFRVRTEFRDDVMVVRVEPLGHFAGERGALMCGAAGGDVGAALAARHQEAQIEVDDFAIPGEARRHVAHEAGGVEHVVVERKIVHRDQVDARGLLHLPVAQPQVAAGLLEGFEVRPALPVGFDGFLQLAFLADAGKPEVMGEQGSAHGGVLSFLR